MERFTDSTVDSWAGMIGHLYDAATSDAHPGRMLELFAEISGGHTGVLCIFGPDEFQGLSHGVPEEAIEVYEAHFQTLDPWTRPTLALSPHVYAPPRLGRALLPESDLVKTEYFQDFARPFDLAEVMGGAVPLSQGRTAVYSTHRPWTGERFGEDDEKRVRLFVPHLQRALQLRERLGFDAASEGYAALDRLAFGAIVCDAFGRVRFANDAAEEAARRGHGVSLAGTGGSVGALLSAERRRLLALVHDACTGGPGGALAVQGRDGTTSAVLISPLPRRLGRARGLALLTLREIGTSPAPRTELLSSLFGLTRAEASLAASIAGGATLADIMKQGRRSENTLRTQLSQIFRKTGTRSQAALVRVIANLPSVR